MFCKKQQHSKNILKLKNFTGSYKKNLCPENLFSLILSLSWTKNVYKYILKFKQNITYTKFQYLREKCPNTEFFLVRIFLYSVRIQENTDKKNSVFGHFSRSEYSFIMSLKGLSQSLVLTALKPCQLHRKLFKNLFALLQIVFSIVITQKALKTFHDFKDSQDLIFKYSFNNTKSKTSTRPFT